MIIKHIGIKVVKDEKTGQEKREPVENDISHLVNSATWSGSRIQAARKLEFTYTQEPRDPNFPVYPVGVGETIKAYSEDGALQFVGNIYSTERKTSASTISVTCYDNMFILSKSKTTKKFTNMTAEDITKSVCAEMGIKVGKLAKTKEKMTFIANNKSGYQIIVMAYTEASKKTGKKYQTMMEGDELDVIEKGSLIEGLVIDQYRNITDSSYKESIENMVNKVMVTDDKGNLIRYESNDDHIKRYSMIQEVYKEGKNKNTAEEVKAIFKGPERSGTIDCLGDYDAVSSYSVEIRDVITQLSGKFWIKSDTHTFQNGQHTMKLEIEFENIMNKENLETEENNQKQTAKDVETGSGQGRRSTIKQQARKVDYYA
ncbi:hypothetical protein [Veillonella sp. VA139]|uniref:XkdQ/YqbQ family protein n=1 Tax=Veillonella sp. VA139 TaxID=741830 RepID=UPI00198040BD|nr:hypothetical protein [Veillonella sp. VA139]